MPAAAVGLLAAAAMLAASSTIAPGVASAGEPGSQAAATARTDKDKPSERRYVDPTLGAKPRALVAAPKPLLPSQKKKVKGGLRPNGPSPGIVGGGPANVGEYPYFVSLRRTSTGSAFCGGSLLSTTKVLTAAHCVDGSAPASIQVRIGGTTVVGADTGVARNISAVTVSPSWSPSTNENDVAILTLSTPITRTDFAAQWLRLAQGNELGLVDPGDTSTVIGHGTTCFGCAASNQLLEVAVPIQSDATMSAAYGASFHGATMVGAGPLGGGQDSCQGDSGGPLLITSPVQDIQIGDVSWGNGCAFANFPGVYGELYQGSMAAFANGQVLRPTNDRFTGALSLAGNAGSTSGSNENATTDPGETTGETTVWYNWTPSVSGNAQIAVNQHGYDSEVDVFTGASVSTLALVAHNDDANGSLQSEVEFNATAGTTYRIRVDGFFFDYGAFQLSYGVNRPANDDFGSAQVLTGVVGGPVGASTGTATGEAGEPSPVFGSADASLWYAWTAPESGTARFTTNGSDYDTTVAAYTGSFLTGLATVASNDDYNATLQSLVSFPVTAGTVYRIQVGGFAGRRGNVSLQFAVNPESNDLFAAARVIAGASGSVAGSNTRAIGEPGEPMLISPPDTTVWYQWTAPVTGTVQFRTCGSSFDTVLAAATGTFIIGLTAVASNDDSACGLQSTISFGATAGTTYRIWVDGFAGSRGTIVLSWN